MKQTRIAFVCLALFLGLSAFAAADSSQATVVDPLTATFLASLSAPDQGQASLPELGIPDPIQLACDDEFCNANDINSCQLDCTPCSGTLRCRFSTCSMTCTCTC